MSEQLISAYNIDYFQLRDALATEQWKSADEETGMVMLKIADRVTAGWIREEDIIAFPCPDLKTIDYLSAILNSKN